MKKFLGIMVLGLLWCNVGFANNHHSFLICETKPENGVYVTELEIDLEKKIIYRKGAKYTITHMDDLYITAIRGGEGDDRILLNRYTLEMGYSHDDKMNKLSDKGERAYCKKIKRKI